MQSFESKIHIISRLGTASKLSSRTSGQVRQSRRVENASHFFTEAKIRHKPRAKEQAPYTLCMSRSLSKDPT